MMIKHIFITILMLTSILDVTAQDFYHGVDLSYVNELEDCDTEYYAGDTITDPYLALATKGANLVRLRLWHDPSWTNYSNFPDVKKSIDRAKKEKMNVLLDFHYSDFWTDPARQWRPDAWNSIMSDSVLADSLYQYTYNTLEALALIDLLPEMVQVGNETNGNILIKRGEQDISNGSPGLFPIDWERQTMLLHKGIEAVEAIENKYKKEIKTVIHIAQPENVDWWFRDATANGLEGYDIIGMSYYPQYADEDPKEVGQFIARTKALYNKDVMIVEVAFPWTTRFNDSAGNLYGNQSKIPTYGNTFSQEVQRDFMTELTYLTKINGGIGVVYWEPAWVSSSCKTYWATGSNVENATLFDFDNKLHIGADYLSYNYDSVPQGLKDQNVKFRFNASGLDVTEGVFVTGSFTGNPWEFKSMTAVNDSIYELEVDVEGRSENSFIFYNNDDWSLSFREEVPSACASVDGTFRKLLVTNQPLIYDLAWNSCDAQSVIVNNVITDIPFDDNLSTTVFPTYVDSQLFIETKENISGLSVIMPNGKVVYTSDTYTSPLEVSFLSFGIYILQISTQDGVIQRRFVKN